MLFQSANNTAVIDCTYNDQPENLFVLIQLEDYIPEVEEFYRKNHSGRKLQWHHLMSNGVVSIWSFFVVLLLQQTISRNVKILGRSETVESRPFKVTGHAVAYQRDVFCADVVVTCRVRRCSRVPLALSFSWSLRMGYSSGAVYLQELSRVQTM